LFLGLGFVVFSSGDCDIFSSGVKIFSFLSVIRGFLAFNSSLSLRFFQERTLILFGFVGLCGGVIFFFSLHSFGHDFTRLVVIQEADVHVSLYPFGWIMFV